MQTASRVILVVFAQIRWLQAFIWCFSAGHIHAAAGFQTKPGCMAELSPLNRVLERVSDLKK